MSLKGEVDSNTNWSPDFAAGQVQDGRRFRSLTIVDVHSAQYRKRNSSPSPARSQQGANTFRNPGYFTVNGGISKAFAVPFFMGQEAKFVLRGDAINLLNRTNWQGIDNDLTDPTFGFSTNSNQKRYLQLGGRVEF